ncbi:MAG: hypothetical protein ACT4OY_01135 [Alphaproteobacteria bacterium]
MGFIFQWIDVAWMAAGVAIVHRHQRLYTAGFFIGSMVMMRLLTELMESIGYSRGLIGLMDTPARTRGLVLYSLSYFFTIIFLYARPQTPQVIVMAGTLSIFFMTSLIFTFVMVL